MTPPTAPHRLPEAETPRHAGNTPYRLLDAWRGVAALWVVLLHVRLPTTPAPLAHLSAYGHIGVPMFFVISGYCIASAAMRSMNAPRSVPKFLWARVRRIYPPYFLAVLVAAALSLILTVLVEHHILGGSQLAAINLRHQTWQFYLGTLTLTQHSLHAPLIIPVLWSLCYEAAFYAIVAALLGLTLWAGQGQRLLDALGLVTLGDLLWQTLAPRPLPFPWDLWAQFGLGALTYQVLAQPERRLPRIVFGLCAVLVLAYAAGHRAEAWTDGLSTGFEAAFTLGFALLLLLLFRWDSRLAAQRPVRLLTGVGLFSYSLYLIHLLALGIITQGLSRLPGLDAHGWLMYALRLTLCLLVGRVFFHICERPFLDTRQRQVVRETRRKIADISGLERPG